MQIYFKNSFVSLYYDKQAKLGKAIWHGHLQGAELRESYMLVVEVIDRFNLHFWLTDDSLMKSISPADLKWCLDVHVPRMASSSLLRMARIPSKFEDNREAIDLMVEKGHTHDLKLVFQNFTNEEDAMAWLSEPL